MRVNQIKILHKAVVVNIIFIQSSKKVSLSGDDHSNKNHRLLGNPHSHQLWIWIVRKKKKYHIPDAASERV